MNHKTLLLLAASLAPMLISCATTGPDAVRSSKDANEITAVTVDEKTSDFLVEMVDARLMDYQEGKLATERGTSADIRSYGALMMQDQTKLLAELKPLAASQSVVVPTTIGAEKRDGLKDLLAATGKDFDKKFIRSIRIDHERDVKEFGKATGFANAPVREFAQRNLPMIQSHLEGIERIEKEH